MSGSGPLLEGERVLLRPWRDDDADAWAAMHADPSVMRTLGPLQTREASLATAQRLALRLAEHGFGWWVLEIKDGSRFAGAIALQDVPFDAPFTPAFEVGWRLCAGSWGQGYATEGARVALAFAFETLARDEVVALTARINAPSQRVMQRLGMTTNPADDFDHPWLEPSNPLRPHVLYRLRRRTIA